MIAVVPDGRLVEQPVEGEGGGAEEAVGEEPVEGQDLHLHLLVPVDRRRDRPRQSLQVRDIRRREGRKIILQSVWFIRCTGENVDVVTLCAHKQADRQKTLLQCPIFYIMT